MIRKIGDDGHEKGLQCKNLPYIDLLRGFACLCVVMVHVSGRFVRGGVDFWVGNVCDGLSRVGVPIFVMLSGALLLDENRECSWNKTKRRIGRLVSFFIFWSLVYCIISLAADLYRDRPIYMESVLLKVVNGNYHLWFIPMMCGLCLISPLLRLWVNSDNRKYVCYFLGLAFVFTFALPQLNGILCSAFPAMRDLTLVKDINMHYTLGYSSYFVLGWYMNTFNLKRYHKRICRVGILGLIVTVFCTYLSLEYLDSTNLFFYDYFSVNVLMTSASLFCIIKHSKSLQTKNKFLHNVLFHVSRNSLGIYAVHLIVIDRLEFLYGMPAIVSIPAVFTLCIAISLLIVYVLKRIPIIRQFV